MKVFICWSGDRSQAAANVIEGWLRTVLPGVEPFVSMDISKGSMWHTAVREHLRSAEAALIVLTRENMRSPWIHYEAGAIAHAVRERNQVPGSDDESARIFTFLLDGSAELTGPLSAYQSTVATKDDTRRMLDALSRTLGAGSEWQNNFDEHWTTLEAGLKTIHGVAVERVFPRFEKLFRRKTFDEPLAHCTGQTWSARFSGAIETRLALKDQQDLIESACNPYAVVLYKKLLGELDGYAMDMGSLLLEERQFEIADNGTVAITPPGIERACEDRRLTIKRLVSLLIDPQRVPVLPESASFAELETFDEKKRVIHGFEARLGEVAEDRIESAKTSEWDLDRIIAYLKEDARIAGSKDSSIPLPALIDCLRREIESLRARDPAEWSLMPLSYALAPIQTAFSPSASAQGERSDAPYNPSVLHDLLKHLDDAVAVIEEMQLDAGRQVRNSIDDIREAAQRRPVS